VLLGGIGVNYMHPATVVQARNQPPLRKHPIFAQIAGFLGRRPTPAWSGPVIPFVDNSPIRQAN